MSLKHEAWATAERWQQDAAGWLQLQLTDLVPAELEAAVLQYHKAACRLERGLGHLKVSALAWQHGWQAACCCPALQLVTCASGPAARPGGN